VTLAKSLVCAGASDTFEMEKMELLEGALEALRHRWQLSQREIDIKRGIVEAERRNDVATLLRLKQEKLEMDRKLAGF